MVIEQDLYEILEVSRTADHETIKKSFRKLALQYHPDRNPGNKEAEEKFRVAAYAYEILSDTTKRAQYDKYGHRAFQGGNGGGGGHGDFDFESFFGGRGFSDIFEEVFRGFGGQGDPRDTQSRTQQTRGSDVRYDLEISLEEAFTGKKVEIPVRVLGSCDTCHGKGHGEDSETQTCRDCQGKGKQRFQQGFFLMERTCTACQGTGTVVKNPCRKCAGQGRLLKEKKISVTIPAGIEDGTRLRVEKEGEAGLRGGAAGDLYVFIHIKEHPLFEREGSTLFCRMPISMITAALGGEVDVPTVDGDKAAIKIPEGTQTGNVLRLKGKGMSILRSSARGDLHVEVFVETPVNLKKHQKELLLQLKNETQEKTISPQTAGFFKKIQKIWNSTKNT